MAVFVSASDENADNHDFFFGGLLAPEDDWSRFFAPAWQERVLDGPPSIPYLHMTEMRSRQFREQYGLSRTQADGRIDEAVSVIEQLGSIRAIGIDINSTHFRDEMKDVQFIAATGGIKTYHPDYVAFSAYAYAVLLYVEKWYPDAQKVDFVVERNGEITKHIQTFHSHLAESLRKLGKANLVGLVGELIPAGKDLIPSQGADVLCWHMGRARTSTSMDEDDIRRFNKLNSLRGVRVPVEKKVITALREVFSQYDGKPTISAK